jgi:cytochrome P450
MTSPDHPSDFLRDLRQRMAAEGGVFWINKNMLAVFEPTAARRVNGANWHKWTVPDRLVDLLRGRSSPPVRWTSIRAAWLAQLQKLTTGPHNAAMIEHMARLLDARLGSNVDLVMLSQDVTVRSLLPVVLSDLSPAESARIANDCRQKLIRLIAVRRPRRPWRGLHFATVQVRAGLVVRRVLRERAAGRRPRALDLADPIVDMIPELGMDRALDAVETLLTALSGPPGSAAASILYGLSRYPVWAERLTAELQRVEFAEFCADPVQAAPVTHRFVKEALRMWSPPLLIARKAFRSFDLGTTQLSQGRWYMVSPHMIHRNHEYWQQAGVFDPDRFLPGAPHGPAGRGCYVPFGWAPKRCVGEGIAMFQLMALCYLMCTRYRLSVPNMDSVTMAYRFAPVPVGFQGGLHRRSGRGSW